jgi:hypothetical protein
MKRIITIFVLFIVITVNSQISNLAELASGKIEFFKPLTELDSSIYGYFMIVKLEKVDKETERFEYVLLDKNLNKVANGEFESKKYKGYFSRFLSPEKMGNSIVLSQYYTKLNSSFAFFVSNRTIDIKSNIISEPFYYENNSFIEGDRVSKKLSNVLKKNRTIAIPIPVKDGFILKEHFKLAKNNNLPQSIKFFDADKNEKWQSVINENNERINYFFNVIDKEHLIYTVNVKSIEHSYNIISIDPKTGKKLFTYQIENSASKMNHSYMVKALDDKIVIVGKTSPYRRSGYDVKKALGLFRITLDKSGKELSKKYFYWNDASDFLPMKKNGKTADGYRLYAKSYFVFNNGSISVLTEKRKESYNILLGSVNPKTADFQILNFDDNFSIVGIETIKKDISKWSYSDYLYAQEIKNGNGVVFFYNDYKKNLETKKKNWILGIVTIIDGKMNHEQIPMSSKEFFISPYIAKEGYILLREYNKDNDFDEIRLEKLNY